MRQEGTVPGMDTPANLSSGERYGGFALASRVYLGVFTLIAFLVAFYPLLGRAPWADYLEDDFFYYLKVAINLAHGHGSTFNGLVANEWVPSSVAGLRDGGGADFY